MLRERPTPKSTNTALNPRSVVNPRHASACGFIPLPQISTLLPHRGPSLATGSPSFAMRARGTPLRCRRSTTDAHRVGEYCLEPPTTPHAAGTRRAPSRAWPSCCFEDDGGSPARATSVCSGIPEVWDSGFQKRTNARAPFVGAGDCQLPFEIALASANASSVVGGKTPVHVKSQLPIQSQNSLRFRFSFTRPFLSITWSVFRASIPSAISPSTTVALENRG